MSTDKEVDKLMQAASRSYEDSVKATPSAEEKSRMPKKSHFAMPKNKKDIERARLDTVPEKTILLQIWESWRENQESCTG